MMSFLRVNLENGWRVKSEGTEARMSFSKKRTRPGRLVMLPGEFCRGRKEARASF